MELIEKISKLSVDCTDKVHWIIQQRYTIKSQVEACVTIQKIKPRHVTKQDVFLFKNLKNVPMCS